MDLYESKGFQPRKSILKRRSESPLEEPREGEPPPKKPRESALKHYYAMMDKDKTGQCYFDGRHCLRDTVCF